MIATTSTIITDSDEGPAAAAVPVVVIAVGVVGGVLFSLTLVILILILALVVFWRRRTKSVDIQGIYILSKSWCKSNTSLLLNSIAPFSDQ